MVPEKGRGPGNSLQSLTVSVIEVGSDLAGIPSTMLSVTETEKKQCKVLCGFGSHVAQRPKRAMDLSDCQRVSSTQHPQATDFTAKL